MSVPLSYAPAVTTAISGTGAVTVLAASGDADVYRDIVTLIITTTNAAAGTLTLATGGTTVAVFNYPNAAVAPSTPFVLDFCDVPLAQPKANQTWTLTASVNGAAYQATIQYSERQ